MDSASSVSDDKPEVKYRGIKAMPFVIGNETFEKLGTIGTSSNLLVYLTTVFNMKSISATTLINAFNGTTNFSPLLGAFLCDTYFGRYKTLGLASISSLTGMLLLTLTSIIHTLHPAPCRTDSVTCVSPAPWQMAFLLAAFALLVIGAGGIRPCNLAFGADQFDPTTESGKRGISSFFNWYYFTFTFAMMVSLTIIVYVQSNISWSLGLAIPTALMFLSCTFFFAGTRIYVRVKPEGSPVTAVIGVVVAAVKKRHLHIPEDAGASFYNHVSSASINAALAHTNQFRFLDKAAIKTPADKLLPDGSPANPRQLCSIQKVEEVKCLIRVLPIWFAGVIYFVAIVQNQTYVVFQALQSDRRIHTFTIPAATYIAFSMLALTIWIPIYDRLIVPLLRRITDKDSGISVLQKMGVGFALVIGSMLVGAAVERRRRILALMGHTIGMVERKGEISAFSAFWLVPQLGISGMAEAFASVGMTEFYYKQFPENMRSVGAALFLAGIAVANYVSGVLVTGVHRFTEGDIGGESWLAQDLNKGRLDRYYMSLAVLEIMNFGYFLGCARWYRYKETTTTSSFAEVEMEGSRRSEKNTEV